ncbi:hypothetical protein [Kineosporia sp. A_224]|uniref:hypothetical protein n=1 Tax=Kineosporia sp. A_224 TaxID=1962180 RepID=UPI000B4BFE1F|nr:hypothetical protein [Kineosporia sp. A_224]
MWAAFRDAQSVKVAQVVSRRSDGHRIRGLLALTDERLVFASERGLLKHPELWGEDDLRRDPTMLTKVVLSVPQGGRPWGTDDLSFITVLPSGDGLLRIQPAREEWLTFEVGPRSNAYGLVLKLEEIMSIPL